MKNRNKQKGLTLVELLVAMSIFIIVIVAVGAFQANIFVQHSNISGSFQTSQNSQVILKTILKELREAAPGANGAYPLTYVGSTTLSFFSDIDDDGYTEKITYSLIGTTLYKAVIKPSGIPLTYLPSNQSTTTLITNVVNGIFLPSFEYFDTYYTGTSSPMSYPINPSLVRLIRINQRIDIDPNRSPVPIIYTVQANLRNLKTNL